MIFSLRRRNVFFRERTSTDTKPKIPMYRYCIKYLIKLSDEQHK